MNLSSVQKEVHTNGIEGIKKFTIANHSNWIQHVEDYISNIEDKKLDLTKNKMTK